MRSLIHPERSDLRGRQRSENLAGALIRCAIVVAFFAWLLNWR